MTQYFIEQHIVVGATQCCVVLSYTCELAELGKARTSKRKIRSPNVNYTGNQRIYPKSTLNKTEVEKPGIR